MLNNLAASALAGGVDTASALREATLLPLLVSWSGSGLGLGLSGAPAAAGEHGQG